MSWNGLAVLALGCLATLTAWVEQPLPERIFELLAFALAGYALAGGAAWSGPMPWIVSGIGGWGLLQLAADFAMGSWWPASRWDPTVYRFATLDTTLRLAALAALSWCSYRFLGGRAATRVLVPTLAWFGCAIAVIGVVTYYTSPGKVLWLLPTRYDGTWGPFVSRNRFAQMLEVVLPAPLWLWLGDREHSLRQHGVHPGKHATARWPYAVLSAVILAAGFVSASRAGAIVMSSETIAAFWLMARSRGQRNQHQENATPSATTPRARLHGGEALGWIAVVLLLAVAGGGDRLVERLAQDNLLEIRQQIYRSVAEMIARRPVSGYGLGTFVTVYPEFARFDAGALVDHAHNDWLEWLAEGGIGFGLLWASFAALLLRRILHNPWGLGSVAVFLHAFADYPFARLGVAAWVFILAGALDSHPARRA